MAERVEKYRVRNWERFQHYKDRNPPWIKLHFEMLASEDWVSLDDASKLLAVVCMLIASRNEGYVPNKPAYLKRVAYLDTLPDLAPLISCGFLENPLADASVAQSVASAPQADARPETETETETEKKDPPTAAPKLVLVTNGADPNGSSEDQFWARVDDLDKRKILPRALMAKLGKSVHGDFDQALDALDASQRARVPKTYLATVVRRIEAENRPPPASPTVGRPAWMIEAENEGYPVTREGKYWRMGTALFNDEGEQVGN